MEYLKKNWLTILVYISLAFLAIALVKADYLSMPEIVSPAQLFTAFSFLFAGFILNAIAWKNILGGAGFPIGFRQSIVSTGLSVFGKYIPGKLWAMVGQVGVITEKYNYPTSSISGILINAQLIAIWIGLILSLIGMAGFRGYELEIYIFVSILFLIISVLIFSRVQKFIIEKLARRFVRKEFEYAEASHKGVTKTAVVYLFAWLCWCIGFYYLVLSLSGISVPLFIGLGMALALTFGFLAIIIPGGLGVREAVLFGWLTLAGLDPVLATTISIASRLWFLIGELFIFGLAILLRNSK